MDNPKTQTIAPIGFGPVVTRGPGETLVFICHASEDREIAKRLRDVLAQSGIESFIDVDDIHPDASFVGRINAAIAECTHFIAIISPTASKKKWPRHEILSVTPRVVDQTVSFLPFGLHGYSHSDFKRDFVTLAHIPIRTLDANAPSVIGQQLVSDILGLSRKPPLGELPAVAKKPTGHGLSRAAFALAEWISKESKRAHAWDPEASFHDLMTQLGLTSEDLEDAISELGDSVHESDYAGYRGVGATENFFAKYDHLFAQRCPQSDALIVAASLLSNGEEMQNAEEVANRLGFEPRRMNPAIAWLRQQGLLGSEDYAVGDHDYIQYCLIPKPSLRRYVKSTVPAGESNDLLKLGPSTIHQSK